MKFLEKIIDSINDLIDSIWQKILGMIPSFVFSFIDFLKHLPHTIKHLIGVYQPKLRIIFLKIIGYSQHYVTLARGQFTQFFIYLRSEEFKNDKHTALIKKPINYIKNNPLKVSTVFSIIGLFFLSFYIIGLNTSKIISGTKSRAPASKEVAEVVDNTIFEIKHHKFEVKVLGGGGGHGGGGAHEEEEILTADLKLKLTSEHKKEMLEEMEEMVDDYLEAIEIVVPTLPISDEEKAKIETLITKELNEGLESFAHDSPIVKSELDFHQHQRPDYYRKSERSFSLQNIDLQVFEEDLKRNHQVYVDFTIVATNRNVVLFLKDHEVLIRDRISTNVEPILPHLPIEDEGKRIIKDKIRDEINDILKKENVDGKIVEVYLDYSIAS